MKLVRQFVFAFVCLLIASCGSQKGPTAGTSSAGTQEEAAPSTQTPTPSEEVEGSGLGSALTVTGKVVDSKGNPVSGATVFISSDGKTLKYVKDGITGEAALSCPTDSATCTITLLEGGTGGGQ